MEPKCNLTVVEVAPPPLHNLCTHLVFPYCMQSVYVCMRVYACDIKSCELLQCKCASQIPLYKLALLLTINWSNCTIRTNPVVTRASHLTGDSERNMLRSIKEEEKIEKTKFNNIQLTVGYMYCNICLLMCLWDRQKKSGRSSKNMKNKREQYWYGKVSCWFWIT